MTDILVICHGNINRSALAEAVFKKELGTEYLVRSAGLRARGKSAARKMRDAAWKRGYDLSKHQVTQLTEELFMSAKVVYYMDGGNLKRILQEYPERGAVRCLGEAIGLTRIADPNFLPEGPEFDQVVEVIVKATKQAAKLIKRSVI